MNNESQEKKTVKLIQKYEMEALEELVLKKAVLYDFPFAIEDDVEFLENFDLEKELEKLNIDSTINLKKIYKGLKVIVTIWETGSFEGTILTINQGKLYLEVDDFYGEVHDFVDYSDCYQGVHSFGIDEIYELSILKQR
ncbi:hypothetical protein ACIQAA_21630 [Neobacillus sp. NPDC093182]|uniref:hypothetical protein n=1 Tax=Neobacillus sp. NPDC093182 TaxID=3364297 RepID=UPI00381CB58C